MANKETKTIIQVLRFFKITSIIFTVILRTPKKLEVLMKKICCIIICLCCVLSFSSCYSQTDSSNQNSELEQQLSDTELFEKISETKTLNGNCIRYKQKYQGLEVFNSTVIKTTDNTGNVEFVGEYYDFSLPSTVDFENIDISPEWLKEYEVEGITISPNKNSVSPVLYITDKNEAVIALRFNVKIYDDNDIKEYLVVSSLDGNEVYHYDSYYNYFNTGTVSDGNDTMEVMNNAENYYGVCKNHYYYVWNQKSIKREEIEKDLTENGFSFNEKSIYKNNTNNWSESYSRLVFKSMVTMNAIEDFWASEYGYCGIDGNKNYAKLIVVDRALNGTAMCGGRYSIILGTTSDGKYSVSDAPEILAHEFTHGVLKNYCNLNSSDESGALHESICDVFGVVYSNSTDWKLAENFSSYGISKDIPANKKTMNDFEYDNYGVDLRYFNLGALFRLGNSSDNYVHKNSYILSNTLYEISKNVFDNNLKAFGQIMFNALRYTPSDAGFSEFRVAFEASVTNLYDDKTAKECSKYFEKTGIKRSDNMFIKTTVVSIVGIPNTQIIKTNTPGSDNTSNGKTTTETTSTSVTQKSNSDLKMMYRQFFFEKYSDQNLVYLFDVTHDGKDDLIVFEKGDPNAGNYYDKFIVFTATDGEVKEIYRRDLSINRTTIMLVETDKGSNIVFEFLGVWTGLGEVTCEEYYLSNKGKVRQVNYIEQRYGGDREILDSLPFSSDEYMNYIDESNELADKEYNKKIERKYGKKFSNTYMLYSNAVGSYNSKEIDSFCF